MPYSIYSYEGSYIFECPHIIVIEARSAAGCG